MVWAAGNFPQPEIYYRESWNACAPQCPIGQEPAVNRAVIHHTEVGGLGVRLYNKVKKYCIHTSNVYGILKSFNIVISYLISGI